MKTLIIALATLASANANAKPIDATLFASLEQIKKQVADKEVTCGNGASFISELNIAIGASLTLLSAAAKQAEDAGDLALFEKLKTDINELISLSGGLSITFTETCITEATAKKVFTNIPSEE